MIVVVQRGVFFVVGGTGVAAAFGRDLDPVQKFYVRAFVEFLSLAGCRVGDDKPRRSSLLDGQGCSIKSVNDNAGLDDRRVGRDAGGEIIVGSMERDPEIANRWLNEIEDPLERQSGSLAVGYFLSDIGDLNFLW